jgi:hypothetical protein
MKIGFKIKNSKFDTMFDSKSSDRTSCASACTLVFIAGNQRIASSSNIPLIDSTMGFHQWSTRSNRDSGCSNIESYRKLLILYASKMLNQSASNKFVDMTLNTSCKSIASFTSDELVASGIATTTQYSE